MNKLNNWPASVNKDALSKIKYKRILQSKTNSIVACSINDIGIKIDVNLLIFYM